MTFKLSGAGKFFSRRT